MAPQEQSTDEHLRLLCALSAPATTVAVPPETVVHLGVLARRHALTPLFSAALARAGLLPCDLADKSRSLAARNLQQTQELLNIMRSFDEHGIRCLGFKGPSLALLLHNNVGLREFLDLDLLVPTDDAIRAIASLRELELIPDSEFTEPQLRQLLHHGTDLTFLKKASETSVELHWQIAHAYVGPQFEFDLLWDRRIAVEFGSHRWPTFSPSDQLLLLSLHGIRHFWESLCWVADVAYLLARFDLDWDYIGAAAEHLQLAGCIEVALTLAREYFGVSPASQPGYRLLPTDGQAVQRAIQLSMQRIANAHNPPELSQQEHLALAALFGGRFARIRYLSRLVWADGPTEWDQVKLPPSLHSLYKVVRLYRLMRRTTAHRSR
jgi:putative nucleotidyltransferase-like protein